MPLRLTKFRGRALIYRSRPRKGVGLEQTDQNPIAGMNADEVIKFYEGPLLRGEFYKMITKVVIAEANLGNAIAAIATGRTSDGLDSLRDAYEHLQDAQSLLPRMDDGTEAAMRSILEEPE